MNPLTQTRPLDTFALHSAIESLPPRSMSNATRSALEVCAQLCRNGPRPADSEFIAAYAGVSGRCMRERLRWLEARGWIRRDFTTSNIPILHVIDRLPDGYQNDERICRIPTTPPREQRAVVNPLFP